MLNLNRNGWVNFTGIYSLTPDWSVYDFERFPAVQWKLQNLLKLKNSNQSKYDELVRALKNVLY
ncbi:hypothetical protein [Galbibacter sp. BG1]